jgi:tetratricopeptide (TPR) repeat protein
LRSAIAALALLAAASPTPPARAQVPPAPATPAAAPSTAAPSTADMAKARALFDAGARAFEAGDYEAAIQAFEQAHRVVPRHNLVFSIAQAHRRQYHATGNAENLRAAVEHYRRYLDAVPSGGKRPDAVKALEELDAAFRALPGEGEGQALASDKTRIWINSRTPGAVFSIDGGASMPVGRSVEVKPGAHTVRFSAPGHLDEQVEVTAVAGELVPETLDLRARPARLAVRADPGTSVYVDGRFVGEVPLPDALSLTPGRHDVSLSLAGHRGQAAGIAIAGGESKAIEVDLETTGQRDVSYGFLAAGGAFLAASAVFFTVAGVRHGDARDLYQRHLSEGLSTTEVAEYEGIGAQRDRFALAASATGIVGVVVGLAGMGLYVFDDAPPIAPPRDADADRPGGPSLVPSLDVSSRGAAATLGGTF